MSKKGVFLFSVLLFVFFSCNREECCDCTSAGFEGVNDEICEEDTEENPDITWGEFKQLALEEDCECD